MADRQPPMESHAAPAPAGVTKAHDGLEIEL